ncbi:hypothetical protein EMGBS8_18680 [Verrucomicrobiota bacterium]|nr:hypothetical protein EMGBS8_18680 [Verrucomicrobiota bacterium]
MKLTSLLLVAGLTVATLPSPLLAAKASPPAPERTTEVELTTAADPEQAKLSAAKRKVLELPEIASAQQQAKADRALAAKASAEYKHARTKSAESEMAYRKAFDETLAKQDPEAAGIQKSSAMPSAKKCSKPARKRRRAPVSPPPTQTPPPTATQSGAKGKPAVRAR